MEPTNRPQSPFEALIAQIRSWEAERDELRARLKEIDERLALLVTNAGLDPSLVQFSPAPAPPKIDGRRAGAMIQAALDMLKEAPNGLSRVELKSALRTHPVHGERVRRNENGFYNMVKRGLDRGEFVEVNDRLYLPERAPEPGSGGLDFSRPVEGLPV